MRDGNQLRMWYGSNLQWGSGSLDFEFVIKTARSNDGIHWERKGNSAITHVHPNEYAVARPCVLHENGLYKMWFAFRGKGDITTFRLGYAESGDGESWKRCDERVGIDVSAKGWDSEMICYPFIFEHAGRRYMLYNGNGYGKTGFGLAILETT
jgi:hypothetical protein